MDEDLKLYIPLGVKPEAELFTGFGKKQLFQSIVGSLVMGGIAALAWLFTGNVTTTVILALAGIFGSVDDDYQRPEQFVRGRSGAKPDSLFTRTENLPVSLRG